MKDRTSSGTLGTDVLQICVAPLARWISSARLFFMSYAVATFSVLSSSEALIEVSYPNGLTAFERVTRPRMGSLYETAYRAASIKARIQGFTLGRFSRAA